MIPKIEVDYLFDLDDNTLSEMVLFAKKIAKALESSMDCVRVGLTVIGLEVPHAHIHLIPISRESDMSFKNPKLKLSAKEMEELAEKIKTCIER